MVSESLPVVGNAISGGIKYASFKHCCVKLKKSWQNTLLSNQNCVETAGESGMDFTEQFDRQSN